MPPGGGTTTLQFSGQRWLSAEPSLGGTFYNCAGGAAPWGSWFTCEETFTDLTACGGRRHGYVFEVRRDAEATTAKPIVDMGRMMHEAVAIDPATKYAYLTEDNPAAPASIASSRKTSAARPAATKKAASCRPRACRPPVMRT